MSVSHSPHPLTSFIPAPLYFSVCVAEVCGLVGRTRGWKAEATFYSWWRAGGESQKLCPGRWHNTRGYAWLAVLMLILTTPARQHAVWCTLTLNAENRKFIAEAVARDPVIRNGPEAGRPARRRAVVNR